jgi:(R,R)-butanediol dehydrogenase/meso-butanediol dehydrogenase/diacetyl reductase
MKAAVYRGPGDIRIEEWPEPVTGPDGIVLQVAACGICGSDLKSYATGRFVRPGQILGHEFAGTVVEVGAAVLGIAIGDRVTALPFVPCGRCRRCRRGEASLCEVAFDKSIANGLAGALAERLHLPGAVLGSTVFALPDTVPTEIGALIEPLAVGLQAVALSELSDGDVAVVLGLGAIGLSVVQALRMRGIGAVVASDPSARRRETALRIGAGVVVDPISEDLVEAVRQLTGPGAYGSPAAADALFDCAGVPEALSAALPALRFGGTAVLLALYGGALEINGTQLVRKALRLKGSFGYGDSFPEAVRLVGEAAGEVGGLVTERFALEATDEAFQAQLDRDRSVKTLVVPGLR